MRISPSARLSSKMWQVCLQPSLSQAILACQVPVWGALGWRWCTGICCNEQEVCLLLHKIEEVYSEVRWSQTVRGSCYQVVLSIDFELPLGTAWWPNPINADSPISCCIQRHLPLQYLLQEGVHAVTHNSYSTLLKILFSFA